MAKKRDRRRPNRERVRESAQHSYDHRGESGLYGSIYKEDVPDTPQIVFDTVAELRKRLKETRNKYGDYISPFDLENK